jgi:hypothetical protein
MSTNLAKCSCSRCDGHLEFDTAYAGERVACPHCGKETLLYLPVAASPPLIASLAPVFANPDAESPYRPVGSTGLRISAPRPPATLPRNSQPRNPNPFARYAARASWICIIFAWVFGAMIRHADAATKNIILLACAVVFLIGFASAVTALSGIRKHGTKGILVPALIGLTLNGMVVGLMLVALVTGLIKRHELRETKRKAAVTLNDLAQQLQSGGPARQIPSTGNAEMDAILQIVVDSSNQMRADTEKMDTEIAQLQEIDLLAVVTNKTAIKAELGKRTTAQRIIQKHKQDAAAIVESARQRYLAARIPEAVKQEALRTLGKDGPVQARLDESHSLRIRRQQAESELLQFMYTEFGHFWLANGKVSFATAANPAQYNRLLQRLQEVSDEAEAFDRRQSEMLEAMPAQVRELAK